MLSLSPVKHDMTDEAAWLTLRQAGFTYREIANEVGVSLKRAHVGVQRAKAREGQRPTEAAAVSLRLVVLDSSSCKPFAHLTCDDIHHGDLPPDTSCYCPVGDHSGKLAERAISRMKARKPEEPEQRIDRIKESIRTRRLTRLEKETAREKIRQLRRLTTRTRQHGSYVPDPHLRGGLG